MSFLIDIKLPLIYDAIDTRTSAIYKYAVAKTR